MIFIIAYIVFHLRCLLSLSLSLLFRNFDPSVAMAKCLLKFYLFIPCSDWLANKMFLRQLLCRLQIPDSSDYTRNSDFDSHLRSRDFHLETRLIKVPLAVKVDWGSFNSHSWLRVLLTATVDWERLCHQSWVRSHEIFFNGPSKRSHVLAFFIAGSISWISRRRTSRKSSASQVI